MIGKRLANLVTVIPYYDDSWFWGLLRKMVDRWRVLLQRFETWITDGVPPMPSRQDAEAYEELLRLTALFHYKKIAYEGPAPDVTYETHKRDIGVLWLRVRRREDAAKAKGWVVRLVCLGLLGIIHSWVLLSAAPGLILLRETVEGWRTTGWQPGADLLLLLASPRALTDALVVLTLLFLISGFYTRKTSVLAEEGPVSIDVGTRDSCGPRRSEPNARHRWRSRHCRVWSASWRALRRSTHQAAEVPSPAATASASSGQRCRPL